MSRGRSPNRDKAFEMYKKHKGKIKNKDIAKELQEDPKTVSKWKTLDEWEDRLNNSNNKKKNSKFEKDINNGYNDDLKSDVIDELNEIVENVDLNEKQILFCIYYIKYFNASKAYQKAYGCNLVTAYTAGPRLLGNVHIKMAIAQLKQNKLNQVMLSPEDIFQKYMDIAFSDISNYITFGKKDTLIGISKSGVPIYEKHNFIDVKESDEIDGTLITEFKEGKNGFSIKLMDGLKALDWLSNHMDMATTEQKARVEHIMNKDKLERERFDHQKEMDERSNF
ncbi:MAG: terminase small subunit [Herbinix sp.]|nr:terminase small subunit [Herbinix sp.]